ncbi:MAG: LamG domain-containing protein [Ruminococcaceae bacterium]|nr:LamG domain-containing protein [Oscillospiraceae bacterium]
MEVFQMKKLALVLAAVMVASCMLIVPTAATSGADVLASADMYLTFEDGSIEDTKGNYSVITADESFGTPEATFAAEGGKFGGTLETSQNSFLVVEDLVFGADSYTITTWAKIATYNGSDPALFGNKDWSGGDNPGMVLAINGTNFRLVSTANGERLNHEVDPGDVVGQWVHFAIVVDRAAGYETFYINGVPTYADIVMWADDVMDSDYAFTIGNDGSGMYNGDNLVMNFDEFAFFKKALTLDEVHAVYEYAPEGYEAATAPEVEVPDYSAPLEFTADPAAVAAAADVYLTFDGEIPADTVKHYEGSAVAYYYRDEIQTHPDVKDLTEVEPTYVEGVKGQGLHTDSRVNSTAITFDISDGTSYTLSTWVKLNEYEGSVNNGRHIFNYMLDGGNQHGTFLAINNTEIWSRIAGWIDSTHTVTDLTAPYINSPISNRFDTWNHVALTVDRETKAVTIYFNGRAVATTQYNELFETKQACFDGGYTDLYLNNDHQQTDIFMDTYADMDYDELAFYKKALSADEVAALYSYVAAPADTGSDEPAGPVLTGKELIDTAVVYLPLDNDTNNANNGAKVSSVGETALVDAKFGKGADLNNAANYLTVEGLKFGTDSFTVSTWLNITEFSSDPAIFGNKDWNSGKNPGFAFVLNDSDYQFNTAAPNDNGTNRHDFKVNMGEAVGNWVYVTNVVNRETGKFEMYINGALVLEDDISDQAGVSYDTEFAFNIGQDGSGSYDGGSSKVVMDEFVVFNSALNAEQVASLYNYVPEVVIDDNPDVVDPGTTDEPDAPQTFDIAIVAAVASIISLAGFAIAKKH